MKLCGLKAGVSLYRCVNIIHAGFPPEADPPLADIPLRHEWRGFLRHLKDKVCKVKKVYKVLIRARASYTGRLLFLLYKLYKPYKLY